MALTWEFRTTPERQHGYTAHLWQWHVISDEGTGTSSVQLFGTLSDCIADARRHGFRGTSEALAQAFRSCERIVSVREVASPAV